MLQTTYRALDQAWSALSLALGRFNADSSAQNSASVQNACERVKAGLIEMASELAGNGKREGARTLIAMVQSVNKQSADLFSAHQSLAATYQIPPKLNYFSTFLASATLGERVLSFQTEIGSLQANCGEVFLGSA